MAEIGKTSNFFLFNLSETADQTGLTSMRNITHPEEGQARPLFPGWVPNPVLNMGPQQTQ